MLTPHTNVRNFRLNVTNGMATKLAEQLASPTLVLPWVLSTIGAPSLFAAMLVPIKQTGSLMPQLAVAGWIRRAPTRKWFWVGAGVIQGIALLLAAFAVFTLPPVAAASTLVVLFALFSVASGVGSVAFQDVLGKTIPQGRRGRLLAMRASLGGILTLAAGLALQQYVGESDALAPLAALMGVAAGLWFAAALFFACIAEAPGEPKKSGHAWSEMLSGLALVRDVPGFRRFLTARCLLLSVELATPFYVLIARPVVDDPRALGLFIVAVGIAAVVSSPIWGRLADDASSRNVMAVSGVIAAAAGVLALIVSRAPNAEWSVYGFGVVFVLIGFAEAGLRLGRKTYLVDGAPEEKRPTFVAVSNTVSGVASGFGAGFGVIAHFFGVEYAVVVLIVVGLVGSALSRRMPEAERMTATGG